MALPPLEVGAVKLTIAQKLPAVAIPIDGAPGTVWVEASVVVVVLVVVVAVLVVVVLGAATLVFSISDLT